MDHLFTRFATTLAAWTGQPVSFILAVSFILLWAFSGPIFGFSDTWQLVVNTATTIITFMMVFLIQNAQNRDAAAMQAKLDELIRAASNARDTFVGIEHLTEAELEKLRRALEEEIAGKKDGAHQSVERLLARR